MKTKLLLTIFSLMVFSATQAQQESLDYVSNLEEPSAMLRSGNMLYVQGVFDIYQINTAIAQPTSQVIYSTTANFFMTNFAISGSTLYISEENYLELTDTFLGCRIVSIDLNNLAAPLEVVLSTTQYVSSLAVKGSEIYFTSETAPDGEDNFTVQVRKLDLESVSPVSTVVVANLTTNEEAQDMEFYNNNLLISVGGQAKVFGFDTTDNPVVVTNYFSNLSFNKGLFVNNGRIFLSEAHRVGTKQLNTANPLTYVAQNTTYQDNINGLFNANYRDVVLIGDKLFMTLRNQGKVVYIQDAALGTAEFDPSLKNLTVYNSDAKLFVNGLQNSQKSIIYNVSGQQMMSTQLSATENGIDIGGFSKGVYLLKLENQKTFKFVK